MPMKTIVMLGAAALAVAGLSACSHKAQDEAGEAVNTSAADADATMGQAVNDVDAATDNALGAAADRMDSAGNKLDNAADDVGNGVAAASNDIDSD
jgi:hypothetical protein